MRWSLTGAVSPQPASPPVQLGENASKFSRLANYLRDAPFQMGCDLTIVAAAVDALGLLVRSGGALTADVVEFEVRRRLHTGRHSTRFHSVCRCECAVIEAVRAS